jgi:hypothetical protein
MCQVTKGRGVIHNKLGDVAVDAGDLATARTHYQISLDIRQRLAADPAHTGWQRELSVIREKIAQLEDGIKS